MWREFDVVFSREVRMISPAAYYEERMQTLTNDRSTTPFTTARSSAVSPRTNRRFPLDGLDLSR